MQGMQVWYLVREIRSHMPCDQKKTYENRSNTVTNLIRTSKNGPHPKKKKNLNQKEKKKRKPGMELKGFQCYFLA